MLQPLFFIIAPIIFSAPSDSSHRDFLENEQSTQLLFAEVLVAQEFQPVTPEEKEKIDEYLSNYSGTRGMTVQFPEIWITLDGCTMAQWDREITSTRTSS